MSPSSTAAMHADDHRFLADIEMAEAADEAHAVHLARLLLEAADQQHVAIELQQLGRAILRLLAASPFFGLRFAIAMAPSLCRLQEPRRAPAQDSAGNMPRGPARMQADRR